MIGGDEISQKALMNISHPCWSTSIQEKATHYQKETRGKIRIYDLSYFTYGFILVERNMSQKSNALTVIKLRPMTALIPSKLLRQQECNNSN
ncbi:hypothetical protein NPIL_293671 [Nephila pilipes]|uniref:Uncharacterized protein n=1 Tax=Nephila pilipes TaxID=299642 RepID=A0A8X6T8F6_NEPPI|nr:hypothetical protein NPIL_293671 [Nephila pilipes]